MTYPHGVAPLPQIPSTCHMDPNQQACDMVRPSGIIPFVDAKAEAQVSPGPFQDPCGRQRQEWDSNPIPLSILHTPLQQELGEGRKNPCPCLSGARATGGSRAPCAEQGGYSVPSQRTFQLCKKNTSLKPATLRLLFLLCQPSQGWRDEVERTGALEGSRSELESWHFCPRLWGWAVAFFISLCLLTHSTFLGCCEGPVHGSPELLSGELMLRNAPSFWSSTLPLS